MADATNLRALFTASFLSQQERLAVAAEMAQGERYPASATKDGAYAIVPHARNANRVRIPALWAGVIHDRLIEWMPRLSDHFGVALRNCQEPQFIAYSEGHFHRPHRDRGLRPEEPESVKYREVSAVIFLNPGEYEGGSLTFHEMGVPGSRLEIKGRPGVLVAFRSLALHEVTPVTRGERYSVACWFE